MAACYVASCDAGMAKLKPLNWLWRRDVLKKGGGRGMPATSESERCVAWREKHGVAADIGIT